MMGIRTTSVRLQWILQRRILVSFSHLWYVFLVLLHALALISSRWKPFDLSRHFPDLGEQITRNATDEERIPDRVVDDKRDLDWSAVLKRTFESYIRGERPNVYGEWDIVVAALGFFCSGLRGFMLDHCI